MKTLKILSLTSSILMVSYFGQPAFAQLDLENEDNRIAYSIGANIGQNLLAQQVVEGLDIDAFLAGMEDAIAGDTQLDQEAMMQAIQTFMQRQAEEEAAALAGNLAESEAYLAENAQNPGVTVLDSGLQYEVIESGPDGGESPTSSNSVLAHYHGTLPDGTVFDSSVDRGEPATFGNGSQTTLLADTKEAVDKFYEVAISKGATDEGRPGVRKDGNYYAYVRDLDGNKIAAKSILT